jgi:hypothetical protein
MLQFFRRVGFLKGHWLAFTIKATFFIEMLKKKKLPGQVCSRPMDPAADASAELGWKNNSRKLLQ